MLSVALIASVLSIPLSSLAHPGHGQLLQKRVVSPDNSCGGTNGYTCPASLPCCSKYGWCGTTYDYCGVECQPLFGTCIGVSPDNTCGAPNNYICPQSLPCCSQYGHCGSTTEYCGTGCQSGFGTCGSGTGTTTTPPSTTTTPPSGQPSGPVSPDNTCGGANGYICPADLQCCSQYGFCGTTDAYCGTGCQPLFGTCTSTGGSGTTTGPGSTPTGGTVGIPRPKIGSVPYGTVILECNTPGDVAVTYDDGPYIYTSDLLDTLDAAGVKATFFIVGNNGNGAIDQTPAWTSVIQRMYNSGHQVASHTWDHADLTTLSSAARKDEMYKNEQAFANILGVFPTYMRPPYLAFENNCDQCGPDLSDLGYHVISTNLDTKDYANDDPSLIQTSKDTFNAFLTAGDPSSDSFIVLNHDIHQQTVYNLTAYELSRISALGYRQVTVGECLGDPAGNWYRDASSAQQSSAQALARPAAISTNQLAGLPPPSNVCTFVESPAVALDVPNIASNSTARMMRRLKLDRKTMSPANY